MCINLAPIIFSIIQCHSSHFIKIANYFWKSICAIKLNRMFNSFFDNFLFVHLIMFISKRCVQWEHSFHRSASKKTLSSGRASLSIWYFFPTGVLAEINLLENGQKIRRHSQNSLKKNLIAPISLYFYSPLSNWFFFVCFCEICLSKMFFYFTLIHFLFSLLLIYHPFFTFSFSTFIHLKFWI